MRAILGILLVVLFAGCEKYEMVSDPVSYMGGGMWTFIDYDVVIVSSQSEVDVIKNDTICINSFSDQSTVSGGTLMSQNYQKTSKSRRFIKNKTKWEFEGYEMYCEWSSQPGGRKPSHEPFWVSYPNHGYLYTDYPTMSILDREIGLKTDYTFETNNVGVAPPSKLTLISPDIVTDLYMSNGTREKAVTVRVVLTFMR